MIPTDQMNQLIEESVANSILAKQKFFSTHGPAIIQASRELAKVISGTGKLLLFGNGGSAADCQHIAAEFINRFQMERRPLAAIALTCDTSVLTSIGNDYSFEDIFLKQVQALGQTGDIALGISTSGNSANVIKAIHAAKEQGLFTMGFSGKGGKLLELCDLCFCVDSPTTARIQEVHILLAHILCDLTERIIFN